ncbi:tetratricopeptide repeat protein [Rosettibacter firmus]|uniref:tetratricopeptide repeat protein n=1 Tax=Rosettibacter firmus TaxID=3111522 RepID=UPI00336BB660
MKYLSCLVIILFFIGCSSNITKESVSDSKSVIDYEKLAIDKFISGSIQETKGNFQEAINEYLKALSFVQKPGIYYALAKNYYRLNKLSQALQYAKNAVTLEPENKEYLYLLASIYKASHLEDSSIAAYEKILSLDSTDINAYFQLAQLYENKRPNQSLSMYKKLIEKIGPEWNVLLNLIDLNERLGNIEETIQTLEELVNLNPSDLQLQKLLIDAYIKTKKYDKALAVCEESLVSFPDDIGLLELKGNIFIQQDKWKEAASVYKNIFENKESDFSIKFRIASLFLMASERDSLNLFIAKDLFQKLNQDTTDWQVNASLGEIELKLKNDSIATEYFKKAVQLAEWNSQLWARLGGVLFDRKKYSELVDYLKDAVEKFPNDFPINLLYALSLSQLNEHQKAITYFERAIRINPDDITSLIAYGYTLNQLKEENKALEILNKALLLDPKNIDAIGMAALIYDSQKNFEKSDSLYNQALIIDSTNSLILNNYAYSLAERGIRLDDALKMSQKAVQKEPENASYLDTIGWVYYQLGDYMTAKKYIEESLKHDSKSATVTDHLGDIYYKLGDKENAKKYWQKALELEPTNEKIKLKLEKGEL